MVVSGPSGSGKSVWTKKLLLSSLIQPSPERIIWCYGQWQPLYDNITKRIPRIEFVNGIPDHLNDQHYIDVSKRNILVFDDLMTEAKCDQRIADLFTKGSHHGTLETSSYPSIFPPPLGSGDWGTLYPHCTPTVPSLYPHCTPLYPHCTLQYLV